MRALAASAAGLRPGFALTAHSPATRPSARALVIGGRPAIGSRRRSSPKQQERQVRDSRPRSASSRIAAAASDGAPSSPSGAPSSNPISSSASTVVIATPPGRVAAAAAAVAAPDPAGADADAAPSPLRQRPRVAVPLRLAPAVAYLPHPDKRAYGGEDAHLVSDAGGGCLGVADGVGGWADSGVCPAAYARGLMSAALAHLERGEPGAVEAAAEAAALAPEGPRMAGAVTCRAVGIVDFGADGEGADYASRPAGGGRGGGGDRASSPPLLFSVPAAHYQRAAAEAAEAAAEAAAAAAAAARSAAGGDEAPAVSPRSPAAPAAAAPLAPPPSPDPRAALDAAHRLVRVAGSATAVLLQLDAARSRLCTVNLGDSGFMVLRGRRDRQPQQQQQAGGAAAAGAPPQPPPPPSLEVVYRSQPLQHFFDCPLQLGACPEYVDATDTAEQAEARDIPILPGDVIVAGTDGLWDNAFDDEIFSIVTRSFFFGGGEEDGNGKGGGSSFSPALAAAAMQPDPAGGGGDGSEADVVPPDARLAPALASAKACAEALARRARRGAADARRDSPYAREARLRGLDLPWWEKVAGTRFTAGGGVELGKLTGGKMDDITVLVAQVVAAA